MEASRFQEVIFYVDKSGYFIKNSSNNLIYVSVTSSSSCPDQAIVSHPNPKLVKSNIKEKKFPRVAISSNNTEGSS